MLDVSGAAHGADGVGGCTTSSELLGWEIGTTSSVGVVTEGDRLVLSTIGA